MAAHVNCGHVSVEKAAAGWANSACRPLWSHISSRQSRVQAIRSHTSNTPLFDLHGTLRLSVGMSACPSAADTQKHQQYCTQDQRWLASRDPGGGHQTPCLKTPVLHQWQSVDSWSASLMKIQGRLMGFGLKRVPAPGFHGSGGVSWGSCLLHSDFMRGGEMFATGVLSREPL